MLACVNTNGGGELTTCREHCVNMGQRLSKAFQCGPYTVPMGFLPLPPSLSCGDPGPTYPKLHSHVQVPQPTSTPRHAHPTHMDTCTQ